MQFSGSGWPSNCTVMTTLGEQFAIFDQAGLCNHPRFGRMVRVFLATRNPRLGQFLLEQATQVLNLHEQTLLESPFLLPPGELEKAGLGEFLLGNSLDIYGQPVRFGIQDVRGMVLIVGWTQKGKSSLANSLFHQATTENFTVWSTDVEDESRGLLALIPDCLVISVDRGKDYDNPFASPCPCRLPHREWTAHAVEELCRQFYILDAGKAELKKIVLEMLDSIGEPPSIDEVHKELIMRYAIATKARASFRLLGWFESLINRLDELVANPVLNTDCRAGYNYMKLASRSVVWELRGLSPATRDLMRSWKGLKLYHLLTNTLDRGRHIFLIDEATGVLSKSQDIGWK